MTYKIDGIRRWVRLKRQWQDMWTKNLMNKSMVESGCANILKDLVICTWRNTEAVHVTIFIWKTIFFQSLFSYLPEKRKSNSPLNSNNIFEEIFKTDIPGNTETSVRGLVRASANIQDVRLCNNSEQLLVASCYYKALHLRCLQGSWLRHWSRRYCSLELQAVCMLCY